MYIKLRLVDRENDDQLFFWSLSGVNVIANLPTQIVRIYTTVSVLTPIDSLYRYQTDGLGQVRITAYFSRSMRLEDNNRSKNFFRFGNDRRTAC